MSTGNLVHQPKCIVKRMSTYRTRFSAKFQDETTAEAESSVCIINWRYDSLNFQTPDHFSPDQSMPFSLSGNPRIRCSMLTWTYAANSLRLLISSVYIPSHPSNWLRYFIASEALYGLISANHIWTYSKWGVSLLLLSLWRITAAMCWVFQCQLLESTAVFIIGGWKSISISLEDTIVQIQLLTICNISRSEW